MSARVNKALFLDRDGVINKDYGYVYQPEQCDFVEGIQELLQVAKEKGYITVVVTNQSGIGRGYYSEEQFHQFMNWMNTQLDNRLDAIYFSPFHPIYGIGNYKRESECRKPNTGMLVEAMQDYKIDPGQSILVGDSESDMLAARHAQLKQAYYYADTPLSDRQFADVMRISSLYQLKDFL